MNLAYSQITSWLFIYTMEMNIKVFIKLGEKYKVILMEWIFKCKWGIYIIDLSQRVTHFDECIVDQGYRIHLCRFLGHRPFRFLKYIWPMFNKNSKNLQFSFVPLSFHFSLNLFIQDWLFLLLGQTSRKKFAIH